MGLHACPEGSSVCTAPGSDFCVYHEADEPFVQLALRNGEEVRDHEGWGIEWPSRKRVVFRQTGGKVK